MFKASIRKVLRKLGYEIRRKPAGHLAKSAIDVQAELFRGCVRLIVFDVGAHRGQTAKEYVRRFPDAAIYSFEPYPESFEELKKVASGYDRMRPYRLAITDSVGTRDLFISPRTATNSLLSRPEGQRRYFPSDAEMVGRTQVEVSTLDAFCQQEAVSRINILKMDVQGGELLALKGASGLLSNGSIDLIYTEVMFIPHYEDGVLFYELWEFLAQYGYSLYDLFIGTHATNGQIRQGDAIFLSQDFRVDVVDAFQPEP